MATPKDPKIKNENNKKEPKTRKPENRVLNKPETIKEKAIIDLTKYVNDKLISGYSTKTLTDLLVRERKLTQRNAEIFIKEIRKQMHENFKDVLYDLQQRMILELIEIKNSTKSNHEKFRAIDLINKLTFVAPISEEEATNKLIEEPITITINPSN